MKRLAFAWTGPTSLSEELRKPIKSVFLEFDAHHGRPLVITLWRSDETGLRVHSKMHDIGPRWEVGVLNFDTVLLPPSEGTNVDVTARFDGESAAWKLVIQESGMRVESGMILKAGDNELIVVAGAFPYTLAVAGALSRAHIFEPEYPMADYKRVPID